MGEDPIKFCEKILKKVSRSFALTIPMLDKKIYRPVMVTYLQDRLLDNFEDEVDDISLAERKYLMNKVVDIFTPEKDAGRAVKIIENKAELFNDKNLKKLTANTLLLKKAYLTLDIEIQKYSHKWLVEMNQGMQEFLERDVKLFKDLDQYCYYVAGTVGGFLTDLIIAKTKVSEKSQKILKNNFKDAGLFLQKVNLIRDIKKDIENRDKNYWPLEELNIEEKIILDPKYSSRMKEALRKMLTDIEKHIRGLAAYMDNIPAEFSGYKRFFAVNNTLGLATLEEIKNNPEELFYGKKKVKVGKIQFMKILNSPEKLFYRKVESFIS